MCTLYVSDRNEESSDSSQLHGVSANEKLCVNFKYIAYGFLMLSSTFLLVWSCITISCDVGLGLFLSASKLKVTCSMQLHIQLWRVTTRWLQRLPKRVAAVERTLEFSKIAPSALAWESWNA